MIQTLEIKNIQSWEDMLLEFCSGLNVIIGSTGSGKTAIIRAIRLAIWNKPSGSRLESHWGGGWSVKVGMEEGTVTRSKNKIDLYELEIPGHKKLTFKAFGTSVPDEVMAIFNISEINLQRQLDSHFLLSNSAGAVASYFNKIANISMIDTATGNIKKWISNLNSEIAKGTLDVERLNTSIVAYEYLEKLEIDLEALEAWEQQRYILVNQISKISTALQNAKELKAKIDEEQSTIDFEEGVNELLALYEQQASTIEESWKIEVAIAKLDKISNAIEQLTPMIEAEEIVDRLLGLFKDKKTVVDQISTLSKLLSSLEGITEALEVENGVLEALQKTYKEEYPEVCPFCNQVVL